MKRIICSTVIITGAFAIASCKSEMNSNEAMVSLLSEVYDKLNKPANFFASERRMTFYDSIRSAAISEDDIVMSEYMIEQTFLELGKEEQAIETGEKLLKRIPDLNFKDRDEITKNLALAYLRMGERMNCIHEHASQSCIFPISGNGVHQNKTGSQRAIELYQTILENNPNDLESRWLFNIAYMTTGGYPKEVPPAFLIPGLNEDTVQGVRPFVDAAINVGLNTRNMAGGTIVDDFNNDGYLDLITSSWGLKEGMHYCKNNGDGTFTDMSEVSGLKALTGGLNIMQTDYNNDGFKDIFVLRGAWKRLFGKEPNSLLRNNGDDTFTDVTVEAGMLSFYPTQTATWNDFNNDGWLDVFIGNESSNSGEDVSQCEFYLNNKNGTFTEMAGPIGCGVMEYVKGVTSGDYNNDGLPDIFVSTLNGKKILLKNDGVQNGQLHFTDVSEQSGVGANRTPTFPTWFWDYDNDGWLDILVSSYDFKGSLAPYFAAEALKIKYSEAGKIFLYRNKRDGTFEEISQQIGLNGIAFSMGSNFGDIDNDGYSDIYMGTGNPLYTSLVPNKMFKNIGGQRFVDVTTSARVGNLQKGHGVSFADLDNDGDEDIYIDMGGAFVGDAYQSSLYINPGQNNNNWINLRLEGVTSNKAAIGTKIKVSFRENGVLRSVYRDVNSGGSFGSNPLMQHIGIGTATTIESIEITWPITKKTQVFRNVQPRQILLIKEDNNNFTTLMLKPTSFIDKRVGLINCYPSAN